ncbi:MAG: hypothetical protein C0402_13335 [Thermodesulfovibrio sp.]|nr:hypothetical protein [Thermodesulfovibrio sp.]
MRKFVKGLLLFFFLFFGCLNQDLSAAGEGPGRITVVRGEVGIRRPGAEKILPVRVGDMVYVGDILQSGRESGAQMVLTDDSVVNISSLTSIRLNQYAFDAGESRRTAVVKVIEGMARFIIHKQQKKASFTVETSHAVVSFSYADLVIQASTDETAVAVLDRGVSVKNSSLLVVGQVRLGDNEMTVVRAKTPPSIPSVLTSQQRRIYSKDAKHF